MTNTLAYYDEEFSRKVKYFIVHAQGANGVGRTQTLIHMMMKKVFHPSLIFAGKARPYLKEIILLGRLLSCTKILD